MGQLAEEFAGGGVDDAHVVIDRATPATAYTARPKPDQAAQLLRSWDVAA